MATRYVTFLHPVQQPTVRALLATLQGLIENDQPDSIHLLISTPGGSVDEGILLFNALKALPITLTTHNIGNVDSIGNVVFLAGKKRRANTNATFMWHGVGFDVASAQRIELKNLREMLDGLQASTSRMSQTIAANTKLSEETIDTLFLQQSTKDTAFALEHGIIHEVVDAKLPEGARLIHSPAIPPAD